MTGFHHIGMTLTFSYVNYKYSYLSHVGGAALETWKLVFEHVQTSYNSNDQQEEAHKHERELGITGLNVCHCFLSHPL